MRTTALIATLAATSAVNGSPIKRETNFGGIAGPLGGLLGNFGGGLGGSGQAAVAELFKAGDAILNTPGDLIRTLLQGNPIGAATGLVNNVVGLGASLPGDAANIVKPLTQGLDGDGAQGAGILSQLLGGGGDQQQQQQQAQQSQAQEQAQPEQQADQQKQVEEALARAQQQAKELGAEQPTDDETAAAKQAADEAQKQATEAVQKAQQAQASQQAQPEEAKSEDA